MKILILDDDDVRHEYYTEKYAGARHTWTFWEFVADLDRGSPWDLIHLDHDLGDLVTGDTYIDGWGKTREFNGQHAAQKICELSDDRLPKQVIIQSVNPEGAKAMRQMLLRRGIPTVWQPFSFDGDPVDDQAVDPNSMEYK